MQSWDADLYLKFANERTQPAIDLISRISLSRPGRIVDLGCGPGNSTAMLHQRWPEADIVGLDSSKEMISAAFQAHPDWKWVEADIANWTAASPFDLAFSNAALHWVANHAEVFPRLLRQVGPQGVLAIQMPAHFRSPVHELLLEIARDPAWCQRMHGAITAIAVGRPSFYYDLLQRHTSKIDMWETEYIHLMDGPQGILEWIRGTGLRPFLQALACVEETVRFQHLLLSGLQTAYPAQRDGHVLFPFRRLFIVAYR
jgi:trans-aconitate 2-methyltransferase